MTLPAGGTLDIPVTVRVLPDAAVDDAVRLTVRARDAGRRHGHRLVRRRPTPTRRPSRRTRRGACPTQLLGGLNVASAAIGGTPVVSIDPAAEAQLYDGVTPSGGGFRGAIAGAPLTLTVDLAGDAPIPVAGMTLDPLGLPDVHRPRAAGGRRCCCRTTARRGRRC